jgi:hypothetical protein
MESSQFSSSNQKRETTDNDGASDYDGGLSTEFVNGEGDERGDQKNREIFRSVDPRQRWGRMTGSREEKRGGFEEGADGFGRGGGEGVSRVPVETESASDVRGPRENK